MNKLPVSSEPSAVATLTIEPSIATRVTKTLDTRELDTDGGYLSVVPTFSRSRTEYELAWASLSAAQVNSLRTLVHLCKGQFSSFLWGSIRVRFTVNPTIILVNPGVYDARATVEVIP